MNSLFILSDPLYRTERVHNGLRLARTLARNNPQTGVTTMNKVLMS